MLTKIYIEALLVDKEHGDQVWEAWNAGEIDDLTAWVTWCWMLVSGTYKYRCWSTVERWLLTKNNRNRRSPARHART